MKVLVSNLIANIVSNLKKLRLKQAAIVMLAGFLVMFNTACSSKVADATKAVSDPNPYAGKGGMQKEMYDAVQRPAGGMNNYNDDAKYDSDATQMQNKKYVQRAQGNLKNRVDSPQEAINNLRQNNPLGDKVQETAENIQKGAEKLQKDISKGTERGINNIKQNVDRASDAVPQAVEQAKQNAEGAGKDLIMGGSKDLPNRNMYFLIRAIAVGKGVAFEQKPSVTANSFTQCRTRTLVGDLDLNIRFLESGSCL